MSMQFLGVGGMSSVRSHASRDHRCSSDSVATAIGQSVESLLAPYTAACFVSVLKCSLFGELLQNCLGGTAVACMQSGL